MPGFPVHHQLPALAQTHVHRVGDAIQQSYPHHPLLLLPSIFPSIRDFSSESVLHIRWPKCWNFSFSNSPSNEYSVTPQETEPDLPVSVQESLAEVWLDSGLPQSQGHWIQQFWEPWYAGISPFEEGHHCHHYPYHSLGKLQGGDTAPPINRKLD